MSLRCSDATAARHGVPTANLRTLDDYLAALADFVAVAGAASA
jgi:hypothetical protein